MPMDIPEITQMIKQALPDSTVEITDLQGDGDHYAAIITSTAFKNKTRIQQHKMVYDALKGNMGTNLHALSLQTLTPK